MKYTAATAARWRSVAFWKTIRYGDMLYSILLSIYFLIIVDQFFFHSFFNFSTWLYLLCVCFFWFSGYAAFNRVASVKSFCSSSIIAIVFQMSIVFFKQKLLFAILLHSFGRVRCIYLTASHYNVHRTCLRVDVCVAFSNALQRIITVFFVFLFYYYYYDYTVDAHGTHCIIIIYKQIKWKKEISIYYGSSCDIFETRATSQPPPLPYAIV